MSKREQMKPEILNVGVGVCQQKCSAWSKDTKSTDKGHEVTILCAQMEGKDKIVRPRPVCIPWVRLLMGANKKLSDSLVRTISKSRKRVKSLKAQMVKIKAENKAVLKSGLEIRERLARKDKRLRDAEAENAKLAEAVIYEDMVRQQQWDDLKKVQNYRKGRKRSEERVAKAQEKAEKLEARNKLLESENHRLKREDAAKAKLIGVYEERVEELKEELSVERTRVFVMKSKGGEEVAKDTPATS